MRKSRQQEFLIRNKLIKILPYLALFLFLLFWQWDGKITSFNMGHDMGIRGMSEYVAISDELSFGKDFFPIENAYSWLYTGTIPFLTRRYREALFRLMITVFLPASLRTFNIALFWKRAHTYSSKIVALIATVGIFLSYPVSRISIEANAGIKSYVVDICIITAYVFVYWIYTTLAQEKTINIKVGSIKLFCSILVTSFLISLAPQVKFSNLPTTLAILITLGIILAVYRKYKELGIFFSSYILFTCGLWVGTGEKLQYLLPYVASQLKWANSGYSEIMSLPLNFQEGTLEDFIFALFICAVYGSVLVYFWIKDRTKAVSWFIIAPLLYMNIRYAFTRSDLVHTRTFIITTTYIIAFYLLLIIQEIGNQKPDIYYNEIFSKFNQKFWPAILILLLIPGITGRAWYPITTIGSDFEALGSYKKYTESKQANITALQENKVCAALYKNISRYPDKTIGMLCDGQVIAFAYDLMDRFKPIPFGSIWENSSSESELMVADYYYSEDAPELIIHNYQTYNGRYMTTYMGTIFQALIENYHVDSVDENGYMILLHNDKQKHEIVEIGQPQIISVGDTIEIPKVENAYVFMKVNWDLTILGNIVKTFLKPTKAFIEITTNSGDVYKPNFFRTLSENGIYISSFATSSQEWAEIINGNIGNRTIQNVKFIGDKICYDQQIEISFYAVPYTQAQREYISVQ